MGFGNGQGWDGGLNNIGPNQDAWMKLFNATQMPGTPEGQRALNQPPAQPPLPAAQDDVSRRIQENLDSPYGGVVSSINKSENQHALYTPNQFQADPNAFRFDQYRQWADKYGGLADQYGGRADLSWDNQAAVRGQQADLLGTAVSRQPRLNLAADDARTRLGVTQSYVGNLAGGAADTAGGVGQKSIQQMALDAAAGNGPTAAQAQLQRSTDANIAAVRSAMAGQRGVSAGQAARLGGQMTADLQLKAAQDAAMLRAQEQQAAMGLAGQVTGQARGQDLQAVGLSSQLALGAQKQLADQAQASFTATGNLADQVRSTDTGLYGGNTAAQNAALASGLGLDQQQLALKQAQENFDYNRYRDYHNWLVTQYGGQGNYQTPWEDQAWANLGAGLVQGGAEGLVNWMTKDN
jgi:hypothetical protein